jgi:O-glycosyl hydrolase
MTLAEATSYQVYLSELSLEGLATETKTVLRQDVEKYPDTARLIQHCVNEYERRGIKDTFLTVYNEAIS